MRLGIAYNVFDGHELLEASIHSVKPVADYICVVYQKLSYFGNPCHPELESFLQKLKSKRLIDEVVEYTAPGPVPTGLRYRLISSSATTEDLQGDATQVADHFFHELQKREVGRTRCMENNCTHFMTMDCDELYLSEELRFARELVEKQHYEMTYCRMRYFLRYPTAELLPADNVNAVPLICVCDSFHPLRLAVPSDYVCDPTRKIDNAKTGYLFDRSQVQMYHLTLVRKRITDKISNVSNKPNFDSELVTEFLHKYDGWKVTDPVIHPHPHFKQHFKSVREIPNYFNIELDKICEVCWSNEAMRCAQCKQVWYCSEECQIKDWPRHQYQCRPNP